MVCEPICGLNVIDPLRFSIDVVQATEAMLGLHKFDIYLVYVTNVGGSRPGLGGTQVTEKIRLSIGPTGFFSDGYLNPSFQQVNAKDIVLSNNLLINKDFKLGPLVYPYDTGFYTGGTDIELTNPPIDKTKNLQLYFQVFGEGVPNEGWLMKRKWGQEDSNLSYYIYLENTGQKLVGI